MHVRYTETNVKTHMRRSYEQHSQSRSKSWSCVKNIMELEIRESHTQNVESLQYEDLKKMHTGMESE